MAKIENLSKQKLKYLRKLRLKKYRQQRGAFLIEGRRLLETAVASDWTVEEIYLAQDALEVFLKSKLGESIALQRIPLFSTDRKEINSLCETETPQGVLGLVKAKKLDLDDLSWEEVNLALLIEDLKDPGNLGTIIRTAHGFGVGVILLTKGCVELFNPKAVRASMGSLFHLPIFSEATTAEGRELSAGELIKTLKDREFEVITCDPNAETEIDRRRFPARVCLLLGSEPTGVSEHLGGLADASVRIPTIASLESLNVAAACAISLYEISRQRGLLDQHLRN
jgi:TrmH family RNA methyltransferase